MKIMIDVNHPAHIHYFRNFIKIMENRGHVVLVISRSMPVMIELLKFYNINYRLRTKRKPGTINKFSYILFALLINMKNALKFKPDLCLGFASFFTAFTSFLIHKPNIAFDDTEHNKINHCLYNLFTNVVCTPKSFKKEFNENHYKFNGYMEASYLNYKYYKPNNSIYELLNIKKNERYIIVRFIAWDASHDRGQRGFSHLDKILLVKELSKYAKVFISSENELHKSLKKYQISIPAERMHDALFFASLFVGEGATMASESAMLGTPAIYVNSLKVGYCTDLDEKYKLLTNLTNTKDLLEKAIELIQEKNKKSSYKSNYKKMYYETIDVTSFMVWFVENYPKSSNLLKINPEIQLKFKNKKNENLLINE